MAKTSYAIALGSNRRHGRHGPPERVLRAAVHALHDAGLDVEAVSRVRKSAAMGPAGRSFANAATVVTSELEPAELLALLKQIEARTGRRRGRHWGPRILDLDIILWSEGPYAAANLIVPHPEYRRRHFVLEPLSDLVPDWRDPFTGLTVRQLLARQRRRRPVDHR